MEKTISYLNNMAWYRLLKVIYIFSFLTILVSFNIDNYTSNKENEVDLNKLRVESTDNKTKVKLLPLMVSQAQKTLKKLHKK